MYYVKQKTKTFRLQVQDLLRGMRDLEVRNNSTGLKQCVSFRRRVLIRLSLPPYLHAAG